MFNALLGKTTPQYRGTAPAAARSGGGLLGLLSSLFGGNGAPTYVGGGQPSSSGGGFGLFARPPVYAAPSSDAHPASDEEAGIADTTEVPRGTAVTIIVRPAPRERVGTSLQSLQDRVLDD